MFKRRYEYCFFQFDADPCAYAPLHERVTDEFINLFCLLFRTLLIKQKGNIRKLARIGLIIECSTEHDIVREKNTSRSPLEILIHMQSVELITTLFY